MIRRHPVSSLGWITLVSSLLLVPQLVAAADSDAVIVKRINGFLNQGWEDNEVQASPRADDGEFARRASLDILGHIPRYARLMEFLESKETDRRPAG